MTTPNAYRTTTNRGLRRTLALIVALLLASLAFGVGLPWLIVDAPPGTETLWAREVQSRAPSADLLDAPSSAPRRAAGVFPFR